VRNPKILVLDEEADLAEQVRGVASGLRPRPEVVPWEQVTTVADVLSAEGPFEVLVAGPSLGTKSGLKGLEAIHDSIPATSMVLAFAKRPVASLQDIIRTGAIDLLQLPVGQAALCEALERATALGRPRTTAGELSPEPDHAATGTVLTVASATGGCGKTFYATNLAYFLRRHTGKSICIVDLDLQFGEVSTGLRLQPRYTISDALARDDADDVDLKAHFTEYVVTHDSGVQVLAAPKDPSDADLVHPSDVSRIIEAARSRFDYVVIDTPAALTEIVLAAFDLSSQLYVMATLDLPSVRNMGVFLHTLDKLKIPSDNVKLVLNKAERDVGIDVDQIRKLFPQGFTSVLPYAREVSKSINVGTPILAFSPSSDISARLAAGMAHLLPEDTRSSINQSDPPRKRGPLGRMFRPSTHSAGNGKS
jgi:pilus assembly protein CpaE